jgi:hypothetical protein
VTGIKVYRQNGCLWDQYVCQISWQSQTSRFSGCVGNDWCVRLSYKVFVLQSISGLDTQHNILSSYVTIVTSEESLFCWRKWIIGPSNKLSIAFLWICEGYKSKVSSLQLHTVWGKCKKWFKALRVTFQIFFSVCRMACTTFITRCMFQICSIDYLPKLSFWMWRMLSFHCTEGYCWVWIIHITFIMNSLCLFIHQPRNPNILCWYDYSLHSVQ